MIVNVDFERMWKEAVIVCFEVLTQHLSGGTKENHENLGPDLS
jgi:hypothetical protein